MKITNIVITLFAVAVFALIGVAGNGYYIASEIWSSNESQPAKIIQTAFKYNTMDPVSKFGFREYIYSSYKKHPMFVETFNRGDKWSNWE